MTSRADAEPRTHDGFYMQVTGGLGYYNVSADNDISISGITLPNVGLMLGGTVIPGLAVGGGIFNDYSSGAKLKMGGAEVDIPGAQMVLALGAFGDYYLDPKKGGLHFTGFFGWGGLEETEGAGGSDPTGLVLAAGGGYDIWLSDEWSVGAMGRIAYGAFKFNGASFTTISPSLLATLTWH